MSYISAQLSQNRSNVIVWERNEAGERVVKRFKTPLFFYMEDDKGEHKSIFGKKLAKVSMDDYHDFYSTKQGLIAKNIPLYESDIRPEYKVLSQEYYNKPINKLNITLFDIEVDYKIQVFDGDKRVKIEVDGIVQLLSIDEIRQLDDLSSCKIWDEEFQLWVDAKKAKYLYNGQIGFPEPTTAYAPINAISIYHRFLDKKIVYVVPSESYNPKEIEELSKKIEIVICKNEKELLKHILLEFHDSDIISGWNSAGFDVIYIYERLKRIFGLDTANLLSFEDASPPKYRDFADKWGIDRKELQIFGRVSLDYLEVFKKFEQTNRASYALEFIAEELLPDLPKLSYDGSLYNLYHKDFTRFVEYNIRDTEILEGLENKLGYIELAVQMSHMTTSMITDVLGSVKLIENAIINHCHFNDNVIVQDSKKTSGFSEKFAGALVLDPIVGLHEMIGVIDVVSLYPSSIRTLNISPETIVGQFYDKYVAYEHIKEKNNAELTLLYENSFSETKTAKEWAEYFKQNKWSISGYGTVFSQEKMGIIPSVVTNWFRLRKEYKAKKDEADVASETATGKAKEKLKEQSEYFDKLQYIQKILLNSVYGILGNMYCKFYDVRMAESTTRSGRELLMHMVKTIALRLDGEYKYPAESIIYGDTDSANFLTYALDSEEGLKIAQAICTVVNNSFPKFVKSAFCCQDDFSTFIKAEQELLSDKGIYISKKMYMLHLAYKDGKPCDKMKTMGVSLKKTTLPKKIRNKLSKIIEEFLKGKTWYEASKSIVEFRDELLDFDILDIGLPKQVKGVEEYTRRFEANEPGLRLPGHVAATILWNKSLKDYADPESQKIVSGTKIKTFYLQKPLGKFKAIAVPTDLTILPQWFKDNFYDIVDKNAQIKRLVDMPLKNILSAIGENVPTKKSMAIDEVFE